MFFDALGRILERAGEVLRVDIRPEIEDGYLRQQLDAVAVIVGETGAAWTELFAALQRQNELLAAVLGDAERAAGRSATALEATAADPLARNATLLTALDDAIWALHDRGGVAADAALREARHGLASAAAVEQDLLARARERAGTATTRRL